MYTFLFNLVYRFKSYLFIWPQTLRFYTSYSIQDNPCNTTKTHNLTRVPYNRDGVMMPFKVSDSGKLKLPSQFSIQIRNDRFCRCFFFQIKIDLFFMFRYRKRHIILYLSLVKLSFWLQKIFKSITYEIII